MTKATHAGNARKRVSTSFTFAKATHVHQDHPERNEDYLLIDRRQGLVVICDGVGSSTGANQAAQVAASTIKASLRHLLAQYTEIDTEIVPSPGIHAYAERVVQSLEDAQQAVRGLRKCLDENQETPRRGAETTVALVLLMQSVNGCYMIYAHVGDSRIYLLRKDSGLQRLTVDDGSFLWKIKKSEMNEQYECYCAYLSPFVGITLPLAHNPTKHAQMSG